tara:strand:+ start:1519 stop:2226 length:708 start_codon:yes stop_codon:yes gene_type:complete
MLGLGLSLAKPYKLSKPFNVLDINSLVIYNEYQTWTYSSGSEVNAWPNHSSLSSNYNLSQSNKSFFPVEESGKLNFNNQSINGQLNYATQIDVTDFTLIMSINLNEAVSLTNEGLIGRGLNDLVKLYRGAGNKRINLRLEGNNYDENNLSIPYPTGDFILTITRDTSGNVLFYFDTTEVGDLTSNPQYDLRINQIGSGELSNVKYDGFINEVYLFNEVISAEERENVINFALNKL